MTVDLLITAFASHTLSLQRVGAKLGNNVDSYLVEIEDEVNKVFVYYKNKNLTTKRIRKIEQQINEIVKEKLKSYTSQLKVEHKKVGKEEIAFSVSILNSVIESGNIKFASPSSAQVSAAAVASPIKLGKNSYVTYTNMMTQYWKKWTAETDAIVKQGFLEGGTVQDIQSRVMQSFGLEGPKSKTVLSRAKRSARSIAITGTNHYANQSRVMFADSNDETLKGFRFISVMDSRTSTQCRALDQRVITENVSKFTPPLHPNCRSALIYEIADKYKIDDSDSKRPSNFVVDGASDTKKVSSDSTYYNNLKKLNAKDQDLVLGPTLGKAFRKMDNPDKFAKLTIDSLNNPLTITQMKQKDNELARILRAQASG